MGPAASEAADAVRVRVPAKINLDLAVGPLRDDGYHDLATVYHAVSLYDEVTVSPADTWGCTVTGRDVDQVPQDASNLAVKAARALAKRSTESCPVHVEITKEIPVAGGMAGGSADAAATLLACDALWGSGLERSELERVASRLGSDIPFLLTGGTAVGSGRGELVAPVLSTVSLHWVVVTADFGLSTPEVYAELDRLRELSGVPAQEVTGANDELLLALRGGDLSALAELLRNDLEPAALSLQPSLLDTIETGIDFGAMAGMVSGSGPTVVFLAESAEQSLDLSVSLTATGVGRSVHRASGPVPGAQLVR